MKKVLLLLLSVACFSCTNTDFEESDGSTTSTTTLARWNQEVLDDEQKEAYLSEFASVLSKVVYERKDVRALLKSEAVKQFDKNYDILYANIMDKKINGQTLHDILADYSSEESISEIENKMPLLNILFPEISMFDVMPENYNPEDNEVPVAVSKEKETLLYFNGECTDDLQKGEIPSFYVFVVNENSRVCAGPLTRSGNRTYTFKSPNFDGTKDAQRPLTRAAANTSTRTADINAAKVGTKVIQAFNYFNKDDGSIYSKALQRDYIYYGLTPTNREGALNHSVSEYLSFIEIDPNTYFRIIDPGIPESSRLDPYIKSEKTSQKSRKLTESELINRMWTKGSYDFRMEVQTSLNQTPQIIYIPLKPEEIWNFNITVKHRNHTMFRRAKYTYTIDPDKFTSKQVDLTEKDYSLGKWNIADESLYRYITFIEEDEGNTIETTSTIEYTKMNANKFNGDVKLDLGLGSNKVSTGVGVEANSTNTTKETKTVKVTRTEGSDNLGSVSIYFYDPIIESKKSNGEYVMRAYTTGYVTFGIYAK